MHLIATINFEQYKAAFEALHNPATNRFGKTPWLRYSLIAVVSFSLVIALKTPSTQESSLVGFAILVTGFTALWIWAKLRTSYCFKKAYLAQEKGLNGQSMEITENGISGHTSDRSVSYVYKWSAFERIIDLPDAFLFLPNTVSFVRVPKESLSSQEQQEIMRWAGTGVKKMP